MPSFEALGKFLLIGGAMMASAGLVLILLGRIGIGRLPGDILIEKENVTVYFPLATMIVISIVLTLIVNLIKR